MKKHGFDSHRGRMRSDYLNLVRAQDLKNPKERLIYRFFEMLPAALSLGTLGMAILLSCLAPIVVAIFIIIFDIYWLLRILYLSFHQIVSWRQMRRNLKIDWLRKLDKLTINNQQLTITSFLGTQDISKETKEERKRVINKINDFRPHLLFVAYGAPYQELWIAKNLPLLRARVAMGVGGAFDYLAGKVPRAPKWIRNMGLEWLYRLIREPWRLKRQLALVKFIWLVLNEKSMIDR